MATSDGNNDGSTMTKDEETTNTVPEEHEVDDTGGDAKGASCLEEESTSKEAIQIHEPPVETTVVSTEEGIEHDHDDKDTELQTQRRNSSSLQQSFDTEIMQDTAVPIEEEEESPIEEEEKQEACAKEEIILDPADNTKPSWSSEERSTKDDLQHYALEQSDEFDFVEEFHDEPLDDDFLEEDSFRQKQGNKAQRAFSKMAKWAVDRTVSARSNKEEPYHVKSATTESSSNRKSRNNSTASALTAQEIEICEQLDQDYERALEEREIGYSARYSSVRQSACFSVTFMLIYLTVGTTFLLRQQDGLELNNALFFLIYTITTVGYGDVSFPRTAKFQLFTIVYIFVGIATLTIMVAQCYQWIALEATRAQHSRDKADLAKRGKEMMQNSTAAVDNSVDVESVASLNESIVMEEFLYETSCSERIVDAAFWCWGACKVFFRESEIGRGLSVLFPFAGLILIGAVVVGPIEGWSVVESLYFAVVSLTTVGFGDLVPTQTASIWFSIFWLPFSIGFMSLFLSNVASFYIRLSDKNIQRLEGHMRRKLQKDKEELEKEHSEARKRALRGQRKSEIAMGSADELPLTSKAAKGRRKGFATLPTGDDGIGEDLVVAGDPALFGSPGSEETAGHIRRERVMSKSKRRLFDDRDQSMSTMKDVIQTVRENVAADSDGPESRFMSIRPAQLNASALLRTSVVGAPHKKPSFALRVLVQERFAEIIAIDVAGFQSDVEILDDTLSVTIDTLGDTADKWLIPQRARKAFRAVAFEALYFVGEHGLITRGADALYDLTPFEFHGVFNPLVAAMGDADTMSGWLASTEVLAQVDLRRDGSQVDLSLSNDNDNDDDAAQSYAQRVRMSREEKKEGTSTIRRSNGSSTASIKKLSKKLGSAKKKKSLSLSDKDWS